MDASDRAGTGKRQCLIGPSIHERDPEGLDPLHPGGGADARGGSAVRQPPADSTPTIVASEMDAKRPDEWMIDIYCEEEPYPELIGNLLLLVAIGPTAAACSATGSNGSPIEDWVTLSQQGLEPLRAGRFHVHTSSDQPSDNPKLTNICIDAGQRFWHRPS